MFYLVSTLSILCHMSETLLYSFCLVPIGLLPFALSGSCMICYSVQPALLQPGSLTPSRIEALPQFSPHVWGTEEVTPLPRRNTILKKKASNTHNQNKDEFLPHQFIPPPHSQLPACSETARERERERDGLTDMHAAGKRNSLHELSVFSSLRLARSLAIPEDD